ncbi:hypothetical protein C8J56DRAFT_1020974 [Mycena floridula]|nr:hypothetical protein C8J56DRAFT_1020974 [Mycena floridula]
MSEDCTADIQQYLRRTGEFIMKAVVPLMAQTIFWTLYLVSVVLTVVVLRRKGFTRARTSLLALTAMMFLIATWMFALDLYGFFHQTREILLKGIFQGDGLATVQKPIVIVAQVDNNVLLVLLLIAGDCLVIWRAYAVWTRSKITMIIPFLFLFGCIANFPFCVACNIKYQDDLEHGLRFCFTTHLSAWILSFCANISATLMILYTAWCYYVSQKPLRAAGVTPRFTPVARIMQLLVESGFTYLLVMILSISVNMLPLPAYAPSTVIVTTLAAISTHCIGMIPTLTILLVNLYGSFDEHSTIDISQPIHFATGPTEPSYAPAIRFPDSRNSHNEPTGFPVVGISVPSFPEDKTPPDMV